MEKRLKKLPAGTQTFEIMRETDCIYVDKTKYLVNLIENGRIYFFARPRRFGKSLTLTTLEAMFLGKKELFKGLYAEAWMNRPDFVKHPVVRLSMNNVTTDSGMEILRSSIVLLLKEEARK
ncbi:MAG: AAA family ATPase, partial [Dysgonamonadaceae bacterium]|nr:AAA family ATPase [Dysgonamonadaceae bacterium]